MYKFIKSLLHLISGKPSVTDSQMANETIRLIMERRSCRSFSDDDIDPKQVNTVLEAGRFAPSTVNLQTWSFITFSRHQWKTVFGHGIPFKGAYAIVICADMYKIRDLLPDFKDTPYINNSLALFNAGLAAMNMTIAAEALGLQSIMLSETGKTGLLDIKHLQDALNLPNRVLPVTTLVLGKPTLKLPGIPPRQPQHSVQMEMEYDRSAAKNLADWYYQMMIGFKVTHPLSTLDKQIRFYQDKMTQAEKHVKKMFEPENR